MTPPTTISRALAEYLTDWLAWVDRGAPDGRPYSQRVGLCHGANKVSNAVWSELTNMLPGAYPFGGRDKYYQERRYRTQHLNEARLAWVRSTLATAEITE